MSEWTVHPDGYGLLYGEDEPELDSLSEEQYVALVRAVGDGERWRAHEADAASRRPKITSVAP